MIESSMMINDQMPDYCVERAGRILNRFSKSLSNSKILILGVAYKQDIDDYRESPALKIIDLLQANGALVKYFDPYISQYRYNGKIAYGLDEINCEVLQEFDLVMITTAHTSVDYKLVQENSLAVFDTKNVMKDLMERGNIEVL